MKLRSLSGKSWLRGRQCILSHSTECSMKGLANLDLEYSSQGFPLFQLKWSHQSQVGCLIGKYVISAGSTLHLLTFLSASK